jgi:hypothetical protein
MDARPGATNVPAHPARAALVGKEVAVTGGPEAGPSRPVAQEATTHATVTAAARDGRQEALVGARLREEARPAGPEARLLVVAVARAWVPVPVPAAPVRVHLEAKARGRAARGRWPHGQGRSRAALTPLTERRPEPRPTGPALEAPNRRAVAAGLEAVALVVALEGAEGRAAGAPAGAENGAVRSWRHKHRRRTCPRTTPCPTVK